MRIDFLQYLLKFDVIDSTNDYLKQNYANLPNYTIVRTNYQTNGRGQFGKGWEADYGENLLFSLLVKKDLPFLTNDINPIIVGAILNMLAEFSLDARFKYPNDILIGDKKIAGILIETNYNDKELEYMIIGIGINVNQEIFKASEAVSLKTILNNSIDIDYLFSLMIKHLSNNVLLTNLIHINNTER